MLNSDVLFVDKFNKGINYVSMSRRHDVMLEYIEAHSTGVETVVEITRTLMEITWNSEYVRLPFSEFWYRTVTGRKPFVTVPCSEIQK